MTPGHNQIRDCTPAVNFVSSSSSSSSSSSFIIFILPVCLDVKIMVLCSSILIHFTATTESRRLTRCFSGCGNYRAVLFGLNKFHSNDRITSSYPAFLWIVLRGSVLIHFTATTESRRLTRCVSGCRYNHAGWSSPQTGRSSESRVWCWTPSLAWP